MRLLCASCFALAECGFFCFLQTTHEHNIFSPSSTQKNRNTPTWTCTAWNLLPLNGLSDADNENWIRGKPRISNDAMTGELNGKHRWRELKRSWALDSPERKVLALYLMEGGGGRLKKPGDEGQWRRDAKNTYDQVATSATYILDSTYETYAVLVSCWLCCVLTRVVKYLLVASSSNWLSMPCLLLLLLVLFFIFENFEPVLFCC